MKSSFPLRATIAFALFGGAFALYAQAIHFEFVNLDDPAYLYENPRAQEGLTVASVQWAFSTFHLANYTPLTWLSYFFDFERAGLDPGAYHATNVLLHAANSVLLFLVLCSFTRRTWPSALVAALFAVHPLHVESVAWISERKDVLSTFFGLLALWAYAAYARRPRLLRYLPVVAALACGLLSKAMLVTLPCLLLLLDYWPLGRASLQAGQARNWGRLTLEKLPLFGLALAASVGTLIAQRNADALPGVELLSLSERAANAVVSYRRYLELTIWPRDLIPYYLHPKHALFSWQSATGIAILAAGSVLSWRLRTRAPYLIVGWFWFLGTLVPVIGLVQVGGQAMADRYTYVPHIGLFLAGAWSLDALVAKASRARVPVAAACLVALAGLTLLAHTQISRWRDSITLYEYSLGVRPDNVVLLGNLGDAYLAEQRYDDAVLVISRAVELQGNSVGNLMNLGRALRKLGRAEEALRHLRAAVAIEPANARARSELALALTDIHQDSSAYRELGRAVELDPNLLEARVNFGNWYLRAGYLPEAESQYEAALRIDPRSAEALGNLGALHLLKKEYGRAQVSLLQALELSPRDPMIRTNYAVSLMETGDQEGARREAEIALKFDPNYEKAKTLLELIDSAVPRDP